MKWLRCRDQDRELFGVLQGDQILVHQGDMFNHPTPTGEVLELANVEVLMPCRPSKMLAMWNNFRAAADKNGWAMPVEPLFFVKTPNSYAAHGQPIPAPGAPVGRVAYEGELAVVIGRRCKAVSVEQASEYIFGYTCANDVTAIELLNRDPSFAQWTRAKGFDGFGVVGPVIATEVDLSQAHVRTLVAGRERQNYPLADMIFGPAELVSRLSQDMTLEPGDIILCGTSVGVLPMKPGSQVDIEIDGIGRLSNVYG